MREVGFIVAILIFVAYLLYYIADDKTLKCPRCKKKTEQYPLKFGEYWECECGHKFVPSSYLPCPWRDRDKE